MAKHQIPVHSLVDGQTVVIDDQSVWAIPIEELAQQIRLVSPMRAELSFYPQEGGLLIRGSMTGEVGLACNRCAEEAFACLNVDITSFEPLPIADNDIDEDEEALEADPDLDVTVFTSFEDVLCFDMAAFLWEEFALALPVKPLCIEQCKGLCTTCGSNLNTMQCACNTDEGDLRLAALRGLVVPQKNILHK